MKKLFSVFVAMIMVIMMGMTNLAGQWSLINGYWYYIQDDGSFATGSITDNGKQYYLHSDGHMAANETINGVYYSVDGHLDTDRKLEVGVYQPNPCTAVLRKNYTEYTVDSARYGIVYNPAYIDYSLNNELVMNCGNETYNFTHSHYRDELYVYGWFNKITVISSTVFKITFKVADNAFLELEYNKV